MSEAAGTASLVGSETAQTPPPTTTEPVSTQPEPVKDNSLVGEAKPVEAAFTPLTMENLKFPDGVEVNQALATGLLGVLNDQKLDPAGRAQALVDLHLKANEQASEKASEFYREIQDKWVGEAVQEFGGEEKLKPILGNISKLIDKFGGNQEQVKELRELFSLTGAGNSPRMVGFLNNIAQQLVVEGRPVGGAPSGGDQRTAADILYPNMAKG